MKDSERVSNDQKRVKNNVIRIFFIVLVIFTPIIFFGYEYASYQNQPNQKMPWISWYDDPQETVYISWETETPTTGKILLYEETNSNLIGEFTEPTSSSIHHLNLTGLQEDTQYYYKVEINGDIFGQGEFKTAPSSYEEFKWVMTSDTQQLLTPGHHYRLAEAIKDEDYAFMIDIGDLVHKGSEKDMYNNFFNVGSEYLDTIPFVPVIGNHDEFEQLSWFMDYFVQTKDPTDSQFFYSFNWSSVHFQICHFTWGIYEEFTTEQIEWLENDLKNAQSMPFRLVFFHCPIIGASFFGRNQILESQLLPMLQDYNVTAVISGHEHHYERGQMDDMMYMILGGGGGMLDIGLSPLPETDFMTATPCYTEVYADSSDLTFKTFTMEKTLIDQYTIHAGGI